MWYGYYWHKYCSVACGIEVPDSDQLVITGGHAGGQNGRPRVQAYTVGGAKEQLPNLNQPRYQHACGYYYNGNNLVKLLINTLYYSAGNFLRCIWWLGVPTRVISTAQSCWPRVPLPGSTVGCCHWLQQDWGLPHWTTNWLSQVYDNLSLLLVNDVYWSLLAESMVLVPTFWSGSRHQDNGRGFKRI